MPGSQAIAELLQALVRPEREEAPAGRLLVGLLGRAIQSSRSPAMHEREAARLGLACSYALVDFDRLGLPDAALPDVLAAAERLGFAGVNVTHPFKQSVLQHLDQLAPEAAAIGAVNSVVLRAGRRTGHNTDSWGFAESFREEMSGASLRRVAQLGAGGAGAAVAYALLELGAGDLVLVDSATERARHLARHLSQRFPGRVRDAADAASALDATDGVVNTTPVGMAKYPGLPLPAALLGPPFWVADIVYFPEETELLRRARALGCRTLGGTGMAVCQAVRAFELFTGRAADRRAMARHFAAAA